MPKLPRGVYAPAGFERIRESLDEFDRRMTEAILDDVGGGGKGRKGSNKTQRHWAVSKINFDRTRMVYQAHRNKVISTEVYEFCMELNLIDGALAKKWAIPGYERLCCVSCVNPKNFENGGTCVCRVPAKDRKQKNFQGCQTSGCKGCCSADAEVEAEVEKTDKAELEITAEPEKVSEPKTAELATEAAT